MALLHRKFTFGKDHDIESIVLRRIDGRDEQDASKQLDAMNGRSSLFNEMVRIGIVAVNDEPVMQPFLEWDTWSTKTRELVMTGFNALNENDDAEKAAFLAASEDVAPLVERGAPRERGVASIPTMTE